MLGVALEHAAELGDRLVDLAARRERARERKTHVHVIAALREQLAQIGLELARAVERSIGRLDARIDERPGLAVDRGYALPCRERGLGPAALGLERADEDPRAHRPAVRAQRPPRRAARVAG